MRFHTEAQRHEAWVLGFGTVFLGQRKSISVASCLRVSIFSVIEKECGFTRRHRGTELGFGAVWAEEGRLILRRP